MSLPLQPIEACMPWMLATDVGLIAHFLTVNCRNSLEREPSIVLWTVDSSCYRCSNHIAQLDMWLLI